MKDFDPLTIASKMKPTAVMIASISSASRFVIPMVVRRPNSSAPMTQRQRVDLPEGDLG